MPRRRKFPPTPQTQPLPEEQAVRQEQQAHRGAAQAMPSNDNEMHPYDLSFNEFQVEQAISGMIEDNNNAEGCYGCRQTTAEQFKRTQCHCVYLRIRNTSIEEVTKRLKIFCKNLLMNKTQENRKRIHHRRFVTPIQTVRDPQICLSDTLLNSGKKEDEESDLSEEEKDDATYILFCQNAIMSFLARLPKCRDRDRMYENLRKECEEVGIFLKHRVEARLLFKESLKQKVASMDAWLERERKGNAFKANCNWKTALKALQEEAGTNEILNAVAHDKDGNTISGTVYSNKSNMSAKSTGEMINYLTSDEQGSRLLAKRYKKKKLGQINILHRALQYPVEKPLEVYANSYRLLDRLRITMIHLPENIRTFLLGWSAKISQGGLSPTHAWADHYAPNIVFTPMANAPNSVMDNIAGALHYPALRKWALEEHAEDAKELDELIRSHVEKALTEFDLEPHIKAEWYNGEKLKCYIKMSIVVTKYDETTDPSTGFPPDCITGMTWEAPITTENHHFELWDKPEPGTSKCDPYICVVPFGQSSLMYKDVVHSVGRKTDGKGNLRLHAYISPDPILIDKRYVIEDTKIKNYPHHRMLIWEKKLKRPITAYKGCTDEPDVNQEGPNPKSGKKEYRLIKHFYGEEYNPKGIRLDANNPAYTPERRNVSDTMKKLHVSFEDAKRTVQEEGNIPAILTITSAPKDSQTIQLRKRNRSTSSTSITTKRSNKRTAVKSVATQQTRQSARKELPKKAKPPPEERLAQAQQAQHQEGVTQDQRNIQNRDGETTDTEEGSTSKKAQPS